MPRYEMTKLMSGERVVYEGRTEERAIEAYLIDAGYRGDEDDAGEPVADWELVCSVLGQEPEEIREALRVVELPDLHCRECLAPAGTCEHTRD
jgi:hypothetical protein